MTKATIIKTSATTRIRSRQSFRFTVHWLTICLLCGTTFDCFVNCQIDEERHQESLHKYQQLQYQIQQQQQLQYQQQMQQQQQYYLQQQHQHQQQEQQIHEPQQEQSLQPISLPLQSKENGVLRSPTTQMQMLKTGASLVVAADGLTEVGQNEYYAAGETQQIASRRSSSVNGRKRKRRPENAAISHNDNENKQYWRGHVDDDTAPSNEYSREETSTNQKLRRRKQPAVREPLAALEKEQKLYEIRDKQRQEFADDTNIKNRDKSYRRPYSQAKKEQESTPAAIVSHSTSSKSAADLKHILKNSGGLSLSEILQQKNLSLDDLLKGKQNALLALQTTAESPINQKSDHFKNLKPARRIPTTYLGGSSAETESNSGEQNSSEEIQSGKNKLKFPTLHRLKLFGTSSRATSIPLPGNVETATKRREPISSTTTTAKPSTTTRLPIYKKRAHQRPTLKPLLRFKVPSESTPVDIQTPKEKTTTTKATLTTNKPIDNDDYEMEFTETTDNMDAELTKQTSTTVETTTIDHVSIMTTLPTTLSSTTLTLTTTTTPTTTSTSTTSTTTTEKPNTTSTATTINSSSRRNRYGASSNQRVRSKLKERFGEQNLKSNSIELGDTRPTQNIQQQSNESKEVEDKESNSTEFDDLENFFDDAPKQQDQSKKNVEQDPDTTIESITARIDRTHRYRVSTAVPSTTTQSITMGSSSEELIPDFDGIDDRTDLLELIEDRRSGNRLFKVLQQRNMTLDQLIEHRKRGSSQLHLATIVEQNARSQFFPGQKVVLHDNMDIVTAFENFPHFNLLNLKSVKPDDIKTDSQGSSYFTSIIDIEPTDEIYKDNKNADGDGSLRGPMYTQQSARTDKSLAFFPSWKTLALASLTSTTKGNPFFLSQPKLLLDESKSEELNDENLLLSNETNSSNEDLREINKFSINAIETEDTAEAIENEVARAHDLLDLELSGHAFKRSPAAGTMMKQQYNTASNLYSNMPSGIRSAIVASAAIVLTSMATFLVIFVVCRLKQRKRSKTNYLRTYNAMKSKMPSSATNVLTTTSLGKLSATSATNSRRSSLRNSLVEDLIASGAGASEVSGSLMNVATISATTNQRPNELLFPRRDNNSSDMTNHALLKTCTKNLLCGRRGSSLGGGSRSSYGGDISNNNGGFSSVTGSTSSLALSLRSAHNISSTKLNTMDPNSPEVQEYLFDTLRKSFN